MLQLLQRRGLSGVSAFGWLFTMMVIFGGLASPRTARAQTEAEKPAITHLAQLTRAVMFEERSMRELRLPVVVCAGSTNTGVLIVQDATGTELIEMGNTGHIFQPGDRIRLEGKPCFIRRTDVGILVSAPPVFDNDGIHSLVTFRHE